MQEPGIDDDRTLAGPNAADLPILVVTRFSYLGQSGWKSEASRDPALLFDRARLAERLALFRWVNLASLAAQTDAGFHHYILTSEALPDWAMTDLRNACLEAHGDASRFTIDARPPGRARKYLRHFMTGFAGATPLVQVVLDDDDGLAADYIATLRGILAEMQAENPALLTDLPKFVSFPTGYALSLREEAGAAGKGGAALYLHSYPYINLGLVQIDNPRGKNILAIHHQDAPKRFGCRLVRNRPMFLRSVHDHNDSRVARRARWKPVPDWAQDEDIRRDFPGLMMPDAPWNRADG